MPEKILQLLESQSLTAWQIAEALHISEEEVNACIEYLSMSGFIRQTIINPSQHTCDGGCGGGCGGCQNCSNTHTHPSGSAYKIWELI